jgi:hypothetical protein
MSASNSALSVKAGGDDVGMLETGLVLVKRWWWCYCCGCKVLDSEKWPASMQTDKEAGGLRT